MGPTFSYGRDGLELGGICQNAPCPILFILPVASLSPVGGRVGNLDPKQIA